MLAVFPLPITLLSFFDIQKYRELIHMTTPSNKNHTRTKHKHIDSINLTEEDTKALKAGFCDMKKVLAKRNINIDDIVSLVTTADIDDAAHKVSIRVSEDSVSQMNMVAFD